MHLRGMLVGWFGLAATQELHLLDLYFIRVSSAFHSGAWLSFRYPPGSLAPWKCTFFPAIIDDMAANHACAFYCFAMTEHAIVVSSGSLVFSVVVGWRL